ncbi:bifunctional diaminohydroxyphosphoribosylaminopyrimidine deaminase/5-amino-6-(5-phosphoribosylamino)uracil reductase RibD [Candidatus Omnitrophota bacterium]
MNKSKVNHEKFMRLALKLAVRAKGLTNPNPLVGAVVVKNNKIVGQGYHRRAGAAHAEVVALDQAGRAAGASRLYVTLEPCGHIGRTAPCVEKIVASGVKEVIMAMSDPNPLNNGKGEQFLRRRGIKVTSGVLEKEAQDINQVFIKYITKHLPFVTVKLAQSLDGKIATSTGDSRWISSESSRKYVHKLRSQVDAILVGKNTVLKDDPLLSSRSKTQLSQKQPQKIVVDSKLRLRNNLKIFSAASPAPVILATTRLASGERIAAFRKKAQVIIARDKDKRVDLRDLLHKLAKQEIAHVLIEGGSEIVASALKEKLVDQLILFIAPKIVGGRAAPTAVAGKGVSTIRQASLLKDIQFKKIDTDLVVEGRLS